MCQDLTLGTDHAFELPPTYKQRGLGEQNIKEQKTTLKWARLSCISATLPI
jgi:hypothetical protein